MGRDQTELDGRTIRVNESKPRGQQDRNSGGFNMEGRADVKLYVGNLPFDTDEDTVRSLFSRYGQVIDYFRPTERDGDRVRGFAFVTMPATEAQTACLQLDG